MPTSTLPPRLAPATTALLVVDVQERLMPTIADRDRLGAHCAALLRVAALLDLPAVVTEQYPRGLGPTIGVVRDAVPPGTPVFEKTRFSAWTPEVAEHVRAAGRRHVLVCGIEAHICVLQTVLDLQAAGCLAWPCTDAISAGQPAQIPWALRRMERAGAVPTGVLSALYELMADKEHPAFGEALGIAKAVLP